jgi:plasmid stabilization system protein ParE
MRWTVVWLPDAESELAELWLASANRESITLAASQIDKQLRHNPEAGGESRASGRRIFIVRPLAVVYRVLHDDRIVQVSNVRQVGSGAA